jgi:hypothetical protein
MAYFSNSSEGSVLDEQCCNCVLFNTEDPADLWCPIAYVQMNWNYKQIGNDMAREIINALVNEEGDCQLKPTLEKLGSIGIERRFREIEGQRSLF